jgi:hypothetical protein
MSIVFIFIPLEQVMNWHQRERAAPAKPEHA